MRRAVQRVGAGGAVERVAHGNLVADDEHAAVGESSSARNPARTGARRRRGSRRRETARSSWPCFHSRYVLERFAFEVADVDVVEERLLDERNVSRSPSAISAVSRVRGKRVCTQASSGKCATCSPRRLAPPGRGRSAGPHGRVAVDAPLHVQHDSPCRARTKRRTARRRTARAARRRGRSGRARAERSSDGCSPDD